jgi:hypothetical protein
MQRKYTTSAESAVTGVIFGANVKKEVAGAIVTL